MQRTFLTNLALLLALNLLVKPFYILGIDAGVQQAVGASAYGTYAALLSLSFLLNIVLDLGVTNYNTRHIARHQPLMGKYLGGIAALRVALMLLYAMCTVGAGLLLGYRGEPLGMLGWMVLNQALVATILYLRSNIAGAQRFRQDGLLSVLDRVLLIGGIGWLLWGRSGGMPFRIEWFVYGQSIAYGITLLVALVMVLRLAGRVRPRWRPAFGYMVLRQSFPYALLILLMSFYYRTDTVMIERLLPDGALQAGIYAQGFRFFEAFNMLGYLFAALLLPLFSRMLATDLGSTSDEIRQLVSLAFRMVLAGALPLAVWGSVNAHAIMDLRYAEHTAQSAPAFALLMWCFVGVATTYIFGTLLTAGGDLRRLNWIAAAGAVLNIGLNLLLIPRWQAEGAAWASLITQVATALAQVLLAVRVFRLDPQASVLGRAAVYTTLLLALAWGVGTLGATLFYATALFAAGALVLAMACGLLRRSDLHGLMGATRQ